MTGDKAAPTLAQLMTKLSRSATAEARGEVADAIGRSIDSPQLGPAERDIALDIVRKLAGDLEQQVRQSLAEAVRQSVGLPHDVALKLAKDVADVALPVISDSVVLTDGDLVSLVEEGDTDKQLAIANRGEVSEVVAGALVERGNEDVVVAVVSNPGAELNEPALGKALDRFGDSPRLQAPMVGRATLPVAVAERLVSMVSEKLKDELVRRHEISPDMATDLVLEGRERATLALLSDGDANRVEDLVREMARNGRLTDSILLRAACTGDLAFVAAGLAVRAKIAFRNADLLVHDDGANGLKSLASKAGMSEHDRIILRAAVDVARTTEMVDAPDARERFAETVLERVLTTFDADDDGFSEEDAEYLIKKLSKYTGKHRDNAVAHLR
ncbi:DUF2336 domain-containing protein [Thalassobaculum sp. OXR-137]|uniref:DUF2336 domain-containing protein n=1 Tax=Thalassobaculum sp. OXR-137 TaxID=3100173 RepID=UPI002AC984F4|nr:DUF2336 domain-containing protein [Thalassobaculum sp. OXR-137]WPZ34662.1 DUF2336 domain-containing protein [Thalassobaculum sp. OXR-137]